MFTKLSILIVATLAFAAALPAQVTVHVPGNYANIQAAINAAPAAGWTIEVAPGTYVGNINFLGKNLVLRAAGNMFNTTLQGTGTSTVVLFGGTPNGATIEGFRITGGKGYPIPSSYGSDYYGGGLSVGITGGTSHATIRKCHITGNGAGPGGGAAQGGCTFGGALYVGGTNSQAILEHCIMNHNFAWASGGATLVDWTTAQIHMRRCTVFDNHDTSFFGWASGISGANGGDTTVKDCIVWGNGSGPIAAFGGIYGNGVDFFVSYTDVTGGYSGSGNINANPLFVNTAAGNFNLQPGSPCINTGDPASPLDPDGTRADMGAMPLPGVVPVCSVNDTCLAMASPALTGWFGTLSLHTPTPNAPIIVLADQHTSTHAIGTYGVTNLSLGPTLWVIADATGVLGTSVVNPYVDASGYWSATMPIPTGPNVLAATGYAEAYVIDPTAANGLFRQSNFLSVTFGQ